VGWIIDHGLNLIPPVNSTEAVVFVHGKKT
jgi:hypothetical protein